MQVARSNASPAQLPTSPAPGDHDNKESTKAPRSLPLRVCKKATPYTRQDFGDDAKKGEFERSRWNWDWFDTSQPNRARTRELKEIGKLRRTLALSVRSGGSAEPTVPILFQLPESMTFGEEAGVGAGFYDEAGNIHRNGIGSLIWMVCKEVGQKEGVGRDGADYYTPAELVATRLRGDRAAAPCSPVRGSPLSSTGCCSARFDAQGILTRGRTPSRSSSIT
jgi:hypothetical protein